MGPAACRLEDRQGLQPDKRCDLRVAQAAALEHGVLSVAELKGCGLTDRALRGRVRKGWLHRKHRGVYAVGHPALTLTGEFLAAVKACGPGAVLSHFSAAAHWGLFEWEDRQIEVALVGSATRVHRGVRVHRTRWLERRDIRRHDGVWATSPARTALDIAPSLSPLALRHIVRQGQGKRLLDISDLVSVLARAGPRPGAPALAGIIAAGPAPTRSVLEGVVLDLLLSGGLAHPDVNKPMTVGGRRLIPDFRWPDQRLVVEADGAAWHDNKVAQEDDAERQALLEAHGERVLRLTWNEVMGRPAQTLERMVAAGAPICRPLSS